METSRRSMERILKSRSFLFLVVVMLVIAVLAVSLGGGEDEEGNGLTARASADPEVARTGEEITFTAEGSQGDIVTYRWDFGDGETANGTEVAHVFETGGWWNVTLTVTDGAGRNATGQVVVGIQPQDVHNTRDLGRMRDVRPLWMHGYGLLGDVGPHIEAPTSDLRYEVVRAFGTFHIYVEVWVYLEEGYRVESLHEEDRTMTGQDLVFEYTVEPEDLPAEASVNYTRVHVSVMIDQGRWASSIISVDVLFPEPITEVKEG